jgi:hypothetical protein
MRRYVCDGHWKVKISQKLVLKKCSHKQPIDIGIREKIRSLMAKRNSGLLLPPKNTMNYKDENQIPSQETLS